MVILRFGLNLKPETEEYSLMSISKTMEAYFFANYQSLTKKYAMMIKLKYASFLMFFAIATTLFSCDDGSVPCDPDSELTGTRWYQYLYTTTNIRMVYEFKTCGNGNWGTQYLEGSSWIYDPGMPLQGGYESGNGVCSFIAGNQNVGFEYTLSGSTMNMTNSYINDDLEGTWTQY